MNKMDEKALRLLVENGAIKRISIIAEGGRLRVEAVTPTGTHIATTLKGKMRTWSSIDSAAKFVHSLGMGTTWLDMQNWQPGQKAIRL
jgi:hypothetical protein